MKNSKIGTPTIREAPGLDLQKSKQPVGGRLERRAGRTETCRKRILVAGLGNIFLGDDSFGCEVIGALGKRRVAEEVKVIDFGICSYDLAYALTEEYEAVILVDAVSRGESPGTLFLIEPEAEGGAAMTADPHAMNPVAVIRMAEQLGGVKAKLYLVGCEPRQLDNEDGEIGLSEPVRAAVGWATEMIKRLVNELLEKGELINAGAAPVERRL